MADLDMPQDDATDAITRRLEAARADERRKVIAELRELLEHPEHPEDPPVVRKIEDVLWAGASRRLTAYAVGRHLAPLLASLLAPEEEGIETGIEKATPPASPSSEPARVEWEVVKRYDGPADDVPFVTHVVSRAVARVEARALNREPHEQGTVFVAREREVGPWRDVRPAPAHEEGSTHG